MLPNVPFSSHSRRWRDFRYVYPVISRRARGLSLGVNLNPDQICNFNCIYCQVQRQPIHSVTPPIDLALLESELDDLLSMCPGCSVPSTSDGPSPMQPGGQPQLRPSGPPPDPSIFDQPEFAAVPAQLRRLNDIAFSGDGEPTAAPAFPAAVDLVARLKSARGLSDVKIVVITNACFLTRPEVRAALTRLDTNQGEIWAKLDAGTEEHFRRVNRCNFTLTHVLANILDAARARPVVIQALFLRLNGAPPGEAEISAYVARIASLRAAGAQIARVQVYTVARRPAEPTVTALATDELNHIAAAVRAAGFAAESYV